MAHVGNINYESLTSFLDIGCPKAPHLFLPRVASYECSSRGDPKFRTDQKE
jgi:hypothetical protein